MRMFAIRQVCVNKLMNPGQKRLLSMADEIGENQI